MFPAPVLNQGILHDKLEMEDYEDTEHNSPETPQHGEQCLSYRSGKGFAAQDETGRGGRVYEEDEMHFPEGPGSIRYITNRKPALSIAGMSDEMPYMRAPYTMDDRGYGNAFKRVFLRK